MPKNTRVWLAKLRSPIGSREHWEFQHRELQRWELQHRELQHRELQHWELRSRRFVLAALVCLPLVPGVGLSSRRAAARSRQEQERYAERTIAAVLDRMLPSDVLPGALQLGLDRRIAAMGDLELKRSLAKGVAWLDGRARSKRASSFVELDHAQQELVLQAALKSSAEGANAIVYTLRKLAFTLYYTHPTIVAAFPYAGPPQPGGFSDFQDPPR
jgi:hypothetical protein